ncbi:MAG: hypothetical protein J6V42_02925 [Clostridia bacterium]|nr:hypothetical protein [Clostridia bacterium]
MFNTIFFGAFAVVAFFFALFGMLKGRKYKWQFGLARIIVLILALIVSTILAATLGWYVGGALIGVLQNALSGKIDLDAFMAAVPSAPDVLRAIVAMVIAPTSFLLIFMIVKPIFKLFTRPICRLFLLIGGDKRKKASIEDTLEDQIILEVLEDKKDKKQKKNWKYRSEKKFDGLGALCGAVNGFLVFVFMLIPLVGLITTLNPVVQNVMPTIDDDVAVTVTEIATAAAENPGTKTVRALGGDAVWKTLTTYSVGDKKASANTEIAFVADTAGAIMNATNDDLTSKEKADSIRTIPQAFEKSTIAPMLVSDVLAASSDNWSNGEEFCGIEVPSLGKQVDPIMSDFYGLMKTSNYDTISKDVNTVVNIFVILVEDGAMDEEATALFENEPVVSGVMLELLNNEHLSPLVGSMTNLGLSYFADELGLDENKDGMYDSFIADVVEAYNGIEGEGVDRIDALSSELATIYDEHGIALSDGVTTCIAVDMLSTIDIATEESVKDFFTPRKTDVVLVSTGEVEIDGALSMISAIDVATSPETKISELKVIIVSELEACEYDLTDEEIEALATSLAKKMHTNIKNNKLSYSSGVFFDNDDLASKTLKVTADQLHVTMGVVTDKEKEAKAIARMFAATMEALDDLSNSSGDTGDVIATFGAVLDNFSSCETIGKDIASNLLVAIMQSDDIRSEIGFTLVQASNVAGKVNDGTGAEGENYETILKNLGNTVDALSSTTDENVNTTEKVEVLMKDITPTSAEVLQEISTPETVKNYGVSEQSAPAVSDMMSDMFGNMSDAKENGMSEEEYQKESQAVSDMMSVAMNATSSDAKTMFGEDSATNITATEFVNRAADSVIISETLVNSVYGTEEEATVDPLASERQVSDEEKAEIVDALNNKWTEQLETSDDEDANAEYQKVLTSIASIINIKVAFTADGVVLAD